MSRITRRSRTAAALAAVMVAAAAVAVLVPATSAASTAMTDNPGNAWGSGSWDPPGAETFSYTGSVPTFVVPAGYRTVTIDALGAQGGAGSARIDADGNTFATTTASVRSGHGEVTITWGR